MNPTTESKIIGEQLVLILERSGSNLEVRKEDNDYILEGIAAIFGEENNNHRIYEEKEYLPHLEYLIEKIKQNRLVGELDHPEKFDVSLKQISHKIEKLEYVKESRQLKIRVRLLDTPTGKIAKTLVDAGVPISISSRAAGTVSENKKVKIKKIFTYDLVADPGFEKAQLERICESANYELESARKNSVVNGLKEISESFGLNDQNVRVYSINENDLLFKKAIEGDRKITGSEMSQFVTVEELNEYSALIKKEMDTLKDKVKTIPLSPATSESMVKIEERLNKIEKYTKYLAENLDKNIQYSEYLAENLDKNIEYSKYIAENLDKNISYSEYLAEHVDKNISYSEYLAENLDRNISYSEYLAENLDRGISYSEYLAEKLEKNIAYSEYIAENVGGTVAATAKVNEETPKTGTPKVNESTEIKPIVPAIEEEVEESTKYSGLTTQINQLLEIAKKQKAASKVNESKYHFFRFLTDERRADFESLDEAKKEKVVNALNDCAYFSEADVLRKWELALVEKKETAVPRFLALIPEEVKPVYEALSTKEKQSVIAQSKNYKLDTEYQIKNFWKTRPFVSAKPVGLIKLNENESPTANAAAPAMKGYSNDYITGVADELAKRFKK